MRLEAVDEAHDGRQEERVRLLRRAQHPGVAAFLEDDIREPGTALPLGRHDGPRLGDTDLTIEEIAGVFAVLATTVADLNDLGVQIGVVTGDGVRLGRDGRPVIVDLAAATIADAPPRRGKAPTSDVRAVATLLMQTLQRCAPEVLTNARAHGHWPRRRAPALAQQLAALATTAARGAIPIRQLADGLVHPDARLPRPLATPESPVPRGAAGTSGVETIDAFDGVARTAGIAGAAGIERPTADLPAASHDALPPGSRGRQLVRHLLLGGRPGLARRGRRQAGAGSWRRRGAIGILAVAGGVLITLGVAAIPGPPRPHARPSPAAPVTPTGTSVCLAVGASGSCTNPATYAAGVLSTSTGRFAVGRPDDVVAAGRWSCGPVATLAMLRPDRGEVWAFPGWPAGGSVLTARLVARVAQARQLTARAEGACDALVVTRADGTAVVVDRRMFP